MPIISIAKRSLLVGTVIILSGSLLPTAVFADDPSTQTCTPPPTTQPGVTRPVGADASTYTYNCTTGLWENNYYTYNPTTSLYAPLNPPVFTYDSTTGLYDYTVWTFDAPKNNYIPITDSIAQPPTGADVVGGPAPVVSSPTTPTDGTDGVDNTGPDSNNVIGNSGDTDPESISTTGPNSNNTLGGSSTSNLNADNQTNAAVNNLVDQQALTGVATVIGNTTGGNATTGNAQDVANLVNLLQSSSNALGGNTVTFVANINGDVNGNLLIDPTTLGAIQPAAASSDTNNNLTVNNQTNAAINNNIDLAANSGNATVANNTTGGNATSGSASAIANVVNLIDSAINSGNSFVGVININGDFNGDILVPPNLINQLIASNVPTVTISNTGPSSNNSVGNNNTTNNTNVTNTNNEGISNNVNATAASGQATVADNTSAGNATSGNANTSITAFNLTGSNVFGSNDLLVFVNVLGSWVGMIVDAPAGATAAELGGGITTDSQNGNNNTNVNNTANEQINNNINANAQSGNANVTSNTNGGNATTGNADTAVNLLNVENSNLSFSGWFGILFINVMGTWHGNFGIEPSPADSIGSTVGASPSSGGNSSSDANVPAPIRVFRFNANDQNGNGDNSNGGGNSSNNVQTTNGAVLAAHISKDGTAPTPQLASAHRNLLLPIISIILFVVYIIGDRMHTIRQVRNRAIQNSSSDQ